MRQNFYSVFDSKLVSFTPPFQALRDEAAIRQFGDWVNDTNPQNTLAKHPEDYSLFRVGWFDADTGQIGTDGPPVNLITASALKAAQVIN